MKHLLLFSILLVSFICRCSISPYAGGTTDTGNAKIAAVIYTDQGKPASGASVVLLPSDFLPGSDSGSLELNGKQTFTDDSGYFSFDSIDDGDYYIEINDRNSSAVLLKVLISGYDDSTLFLKDTLQPYASIEGNAGAVSETSQERFLLIYGLNRLIPVASDGSFNVDDLPAGIFHLRIISLDNSWIPAEIDSVEVLSGQTVSIPFAGWEHRAELTLNTTPTGADVAEDIYNFPVLVRLNNSNFDFSEAHKSGNDIRFFKSDGTPMAFDIEQWDSTSGKACIWVKADTVYGNNGKQSFIMAWGNPNAKPISNSTYVFDTSSGFTGNYHFSGDVNDATAHRFNGQNSGSTDTINGIIGRARAFNGLSYINIGVLPDRPSGTISCWFRPALTFNSQSITQGIWGKKSSDSLNFNLSLRGIDFYIDSSVDSGSIGSIITKLENPDTGYYVASTTSTFDAGTWYYVSWSWGDNSDSLYLNGVLESSTSGSVPLRGDGNEEIGRSQYDSSNIPFGESHYFLGTLDEFRIENKSRSSAWVKLCYMNQRKDDKLVSIRVR